VLLFGHKHVREEKKNLLPNIYDVASHCDTGASKIKIKFNKKCSRKKSIIVSDKVLSVFVIWFYIRYNI
jgi:hypothetical protein